MAKSVKVLGGVYTTIGGIRMYGLSTAVTANVTVITGARAGDLVKTSNATGRSSLFVVDAGLKAQYLTNA